MHEKFLATNGYGSFQVEVGQRFQLREQYFETFIPLFQQLLARETRARFEFRVAVPPRFFAVGGQEIRKAGFQVSRNVSNYNGDRVRSLSADRGELMISHLLQRTF